MKTVLKPFCIHPSTRLGRKCISWKWTAGNHTLKQWEIWWEPWLRTISVRPWAAMPNKTGNYVGSRYQALFLRYYFPPKCNQQTLWLLGAGEDQQRQRSRRKTDCTVCISGLFDHGKWRESHCRPALQYELSHGVGVQGTGIRNIMRIICDCAWVRLRVAYKAVQLSSRITSGCLLPVRRTGLGTWGCSHHERETSFQHSEERAALTDDISPSLSTEGNAKPTLGEEN